MARANNDEQRRSKRAGRDLNMGLGFSLVEMLTAATILSLLALMAVPFAQTAKDREREIILKNALSRIREAIHLYAYCESNGDDDGDGFFEEDAAGDPDRDGVADDDRDGLPDEDGAPNFPPGAPIPGPACTYLDDLINSGYISQIPRNPMLPHSVPLIMHWTSSCVERRHVIDELGNTAGNHGIYDIRAYGQGTGLDGSRYDTW